ncbi:hypothetical protein KTC92_07550 [Clostridium sp. CM027]|uniref:hypothetical protein n=1 Tax=Clostridium sp. CM027 TaxID=2849865 RepID=UPI001C6F168C|nr:hypothetical protein [Clostridium sp. CM027]MBW9146598.1 hypothetical protein [Clostridium sp. CM027]UVE42279.1 hypothetical protein KTC92_07550 [Clostridium sp. CM027]
MENVKKPKVGAGIKTMSIIQLIISGFGLIAIIIALLMKDKLAAQYKTMGMDVPQVSTSAYIISLVIITIITIGIILILMKKELGIYIYFTATVANIVYTIVSDGFKPVSLVGLIIPALMGFFIWKKREIFSTDTKTEQIDV